VAVKAVGHIFRTDGYRRVVFTGMGSSYRAPFAILDHLIAGGIPAVAATAHKLARDRTVLLTPDTLIVAISKSGTTKEILELVHGMDNGASLVALVNEPESVLAGCCKVLLPIKAGPETQIASKSFLCTLAALALISWRAARHSVRGTRAPWCFAKYHRSSRRRRLTALIMRTVGARLSGQAM
jgi:glucosamine--fructose-6-phosphate aminotransferase (isomerizing)